jgi:hypothetical protein
MRNYYLLLAIIFVSGAVALSCSPDSKINKSEIAGVEVKKPSGEVKTSDAKSFNVELATEPGDLKAGQPVKLLLTIKDPSGKTTSDLDVVHEKPMHLLITSDDLAIFDHIHPKPEADGRFVVETKFPSAGKYKLYIDYKPKDEDQRIGRIDVNVSGPARERVSLVPDKEETKVFDNIKVTMEPDKPLKAGESIKLNFKVEDAKTGKPVTDLEPYLGAMAHFVIISEDSKEFLHAHPEGHDHEGGQGEAPDHGAVGAHGGPEVSAHTVFPKPGLYKTWAQFQRGGKVIITNFVVKVAEGEHTTEAVSANIENGVQKINIKIKGEGYEPSNFQLKRGIPAQITFLREDEFNCGEELVFKELGIKESIPVGKPVMVKLIPDKDGTYGFTCGMGMYQGSIVVTN